VLAIVAGLLQTYTPIPVLTWLGNALNRLR
jgi:hypothetical protein